MTRLVDSRARREPSATGTMAVSMAIYGVAVCGVMVLMGLYRYGTKPSLSQFLLSPGGVLCVVGLSGVLIAGWVLVRCFCFTQGSNRDRGFAAIMSLSIIVLVGGLSEAALRITAIHTRNGTFVGHFRLLPRQWQEYADRNRTILARANQRQSFIVNDDTLGWTVGPNRKSEHGLYESSVEGLRSATQGEVLRDGLGECRVALVGDSFTFGLDVRFEDSWAYRLGQLLPKRCRVLNFGVAAYGIDQMYLRYMKEVSLWKPSLVILAFIDHDVERTMSSYGFLSFGGSDWPFAKPRFILDQRATLSIANLPLEKSEAIFQRPYIHNLPFIEYDRAYRRTEWDRPLWWYVHRSYLIRFLTSVYPLYEAERPLVSDVNLHVINQRILQSFIDVVRKDGATPMIVYLPTEAADYSALRAPISNGLKILNDAKLEHTDLTSCVERVAESERFITTEGPDIFGGHYTAQANAAVAACLSPVVRHRLGLATAE